MDNAHIITFIGDDRPGLVEKLSAAVEQCGGNWHESRLSKLGGKFAGLVLVSLEAGAEPKKLEETLKGLASSGLSVRVTATSSIQPEAQGLRRVVLKVLGPDRIGIVREISAALASHDVNVIEMESAVESAPMSAELLFNASIHAQVPAGATLAALEENLDDIANQMTLDIELESV
ncbi:MAG: ACT domain-containing protein [Pseudomonadota bacterium]